VPYCILLSEEENWRRFWKPVFLKELRKRTISK
jgi:hypothetical protein